MINIKIHHIELYVANSTHTAYYYCIALGFDLIAYGNSNTGLDNKESYILKHNNIYLIITSTLSSSDLIQNFLIKHGDGVRDICFFVDNIEDVYLKLKERKVNLISKLNFFLDNLGNNMAQFTIRAFDDVVHTFINYDNFNSNIFPIFKYYVTSNNQINNKKFLTHIDHVALCGDIGFIKNITKFYCEKLDFTITRNEDIISGTSGMKTAVLESFCSTVKFPLVEPLDSSKNSALDNFLIYNNGNGVHHLAFNSDNIINAIDKTKMYRTEYINNTSKVYYDNLANKIRQIGNLDIQALQERGILCDLEKDNGYILQIFSKHMQPRPTFFFELIQRINIKGFGSNNIKDLYNSLDKT